MGGNALKNCTTRRYQKEEYFSICQEVTDILAEIFIQTRTHIPKTYDKETYGDLDIIIDGKFLPADYVQSIIKRFNPQEYVKNGNVFSFEYREFQIDFIVTKESEYETSCQYFSYSDINNLIGRLAHSIGLKLGHDGLSFNWRIETYQFANVILLTDWKDILPVLDLSYERYARGFNTLEGIFEFVMSSLFYNKEIFLLQNRNNVSRTRDRKRKTYMEFLKYINPAGIEYPETILHNKTDKSVYLPYLFEMIPNFKELYEKTENAYLLAIQKKTVYNGDLVKEWTGLSGRPLGNFMQWMKQFEVPLDETKQFVLHKRKEYELQNI